MRYCCTMPSPDEKRVETRRFSRVVTASFLIASTICESFLLNCNDVTNNHVLSFKTLFMKTFMAGKSSVCFLQSITLRVGHTSSRLPSQAGSTTSEEWVPPSFTNYHFLTLLARCHRVTISLTERNRPHASTTAVGKRLFRPIPQE